MAVPEEGAMSAAQPGPHLTDAGKALYHVFTEVTLEENTVFDFISKYLADDPTNPGQCYGCGAYAPLTKGAFCLKCVKGTWES